MRVLLIAALFALATPALSQETPCDRLAGYPALPRIEGSAGAYRIADPAAAVAACEDARQQAPGDAFLAVLLARALLAADPQDPRAATLLTDAGQALPALAAGIMGSLYENGLAGLPASDRSARDQYRAGCDAWPDRMAAPGCTGFAAMRIEGRGGPGEPQAGFSLLDQQCRSGWPDACLRQAQLAELWGSAPPEDTAALLRRACDAGQFLACAQLGFRHQTGDGVAQDMAVARDLYRLACAHGEPVGCTNLAEAHRSGLGLPPDMDEALRLFDIGCDGQDSYACTTLGDILAGGRGVPRDVARARVAYERGCALGDPMACDGADLLP
ncbi:MAG: sel1 repeat family protein [Rhodobacter sp.]|uniref:tetratricopeptide repeat protein n=1 Tax=Pararhodobacter sp. TaxID=2127056 RepID=UPI001D4C32C7|nr:tetratricopeptide repeat protein [Pararhodobacter sp.]MCB1344550.1 sel1 repeat family protein [Paracoccaceae bacterium]MCC0073151.1 sel1 repeat family protein [Rhodobacter sp.]HPD91148.1 tetratricopeptide repeat protein [Pararhodobacter sp.]